MNVTREVFVMLSRYVLVGMVVLVAGCATNAHWEHAYKGQQEWYSDNARCRAMGNSAGMGSPIVPVGGGWSSPVAAGFAQGWNQGEAMRAARAREEIYQQCMMGEGWRLVSDSGNEPPDSSMECQTSYDCPNGYSCRSKRGGGTECRMRTGD